MSDHENDNGEQLLARATQGDTEALISAVRTGTIPDTVEPETLYTQLVPEGAHQEIIDLERYLPAPRRAAGRVSLQTVDDLAKYVARHDDAAHTTVWVDYDQHQVVALLNDHQGTAEDGVPGWGDHRATLVLRPTDEWLHWTKLDGKLVAQEAFAEHIEDGLPELVKPDGATMLEIAQSMQATTKADFKSAKRLQNGIIGMEYVEEQTAAAGQRGDLEIPEEFELAIAPFLGEDPYKVKARLRYRIRSGDLAIGYKLDRPDDIVRDAIDHIADRLTTQFTGDRVYIGTPRP